ncbi:MAG: type III pantothenate kinase [Candidatus Gastranaerophilales bacterium]|nr:type III pantothenate kinase [Candidatus Gastranaerophilales bacterium]
MLFALDIGNTQITAGVFDGDKFVTSWRIASDKKRSEDEYGIIIKKLVEDSGLLDKIDTSIISSVVLPLTDRLQFAVKKYLNIDSLVVSHKIETGVSIKIDNPKEIGADRIVNGFAASVLYGSPVIVVDFGTATSFDIVNKNNEFIGGIIAAGMKIQADALSEFTSKLPKVNIEAPENTIGHNTIDAMLSGIVRGHAAMVDGLISQCEKELGEKATVIATGGYSSIISKYLVRQFDYVNPDLTLIGLNLLYKLNVDGYVPNKFYLNKSNNI